MEYKVETEYVELSADVKPVIEDNDSVVLGGKNPMSNIKRSTRLKNVVETEDVVPRGLRLHKNRHIDGQVFLCCVSIS